MSLNLPVSAGTLMLYYGAVMISLLFTYGIGWVIRTCLFKVRESISAFSILCNTVAGLMAVVVIYSIIVTKGYTANWIIVILSILFIFHKRKQSISLQNININNSSIIKYICIIVSINILFFCYFSYRIIDFEHGMFRPFFADFNYYAKLSQYLNMGYENWLLEYNFFKDIPLQPYHYFEHWVCAILYKVFGLNALVTYCVSIPMLFNTLIFTALLAVIELRKKITTGYFCLAITVFLLSSIGTYISIIFPAFKSWMPLLESPKLLPIFLFLLTSVVLYLYNRKLAGYYILLVLPVFNILMSVAICGTIGVVLFINTVQIRFDCKKPITRDREEKNPANRIWRYWIPYASMTLLYLIYVLQTNSRASTGEPFQWELLRLYITQPIVYVIAYIHIILVTFFLDKKYWLDTAKKIGPILAISFFIAMTASICMRSYNYDATQFVTGAITVLIYVAVVVSFLRAITSISLTTKKKIMILSFCSLSLLMSVDAYKENMGINRPNASFKYESIILEKIPSFQKEYRIGFYIGEDVLCGRDGNYVSGVVDAVTIPDILDYYYNNIIHYSINKGRHAVYLATDHTPFRDYVCIAKKQTPEISEDAIRIKFVKENKIEYIRIFKSAEPSDWFLSQLTLISEDAVGGERFYRVK